MTLTQMQRRTLAAIVEHKQTHDGCAPSIRELMQALGLRAVSSVYLHLRGLEKAGLITVGYKAPRTIQVAGGTWTPP